MLQNAFMRACHCDLSRVRSMVEEDSSVLNARGHDGETPLGAASHSDQPEIIRYLRSQGVAPDLYAAIVLGDMAQVGEFLQGDASLATARAATAHNFAPLYFAAISGQEPVAGLLLAHGADVNRTDDRGLTPLHGAAQYGRAGMARWLVDHGAVVDAWSSFGGTPLHLAAYEGHADVAAVLLEAGADRGRLTRDGQTPLEIAVERGHADVARLLKV